MDQNLGVAFLRPLLQGFSQVLARVHDFPGGGSALGIPRGAADGPPPILPGWLLHRAAPTVHWLPSEQGREGTRVEGGL